MVQIKHLGDFHFSWCCIQHGHLLIKEENWNLAASFGMRVVRRLAPRTCEGGSTSPQTGGGGEYEFPAAERKRDYLSVLPSNSLFFFVKDMPVTGSPRYQCAHWYHPPRKRGGQGV